MRVKKIVIITLDVKIRKLTVYSSNKFQHSQRLSVNHTESMQHPIYHDSIKTRNTVKLHFSIGRRSKYTTSEQFFPTRLLSESVLNAFLFIHLSTDRARVIFFYYLEFLMKAVNFIINLSPLYDSQRAPETLSNGLVLHPFIYLDEPGPSVKGCIRIFFARNLIKASLSKILF